MLLLKLEGQSMLYQLRLEEALLRADKRSFCIVHEKPKPACVLGISSKLEEMLHVDKVFFPVLRRYSGGGTVVIDEATIVVSFILPKLPGKQSHHPQAIHNYILTFYEKAFSSLGFHLRENDYCLGEKKVGGNAQYVTKERFCHHTTLLFAYSKKMMQTLKMPPKTPEYRKKREHEEFLTTFSKHFPTPKECLQKLLEVLPLEKEIGQEELLPVLSLPHRQSVQEVM